MNTLLRLIRAKLHIAVAAMALASVLPVRANQLTLTQAGIDLGFNLTTFATGSGNYNPLSAARLPDGNLVVVNYNDPSGSLLKFADVDGQIANGAGSTALASVSNLGFSNVAYVGGFTYAAALPNVGGGFYKVDSDLSLTQISVPGVTHTWGLWGNQTTGHLLAASLQGLIDIDPLNGSSTNVWNYGGFDGVSVSPDGRYFYAAGPGNIYRYDTQTNLQELFSNSHGPDGTGVITGGSLNGSVISNNNDGTVTLYSPTMATETIIATGGMRGDFAAADLNNGTLFLATSDGSSSVMYRLSVNGGSIGGSVPDAGATVGLLGLSLLGLLAVRRRLGC